MLLRVLHMGRRVLPALVLLLAVCHDGGEAASIHGNPSTFPEAAAVHPLVLDGGAVPCDDVLLPARAPTPAFAGLHSGLPLSDVLTVGARVRIPSTPTALAHRPLFLLHAAFLI